MSDAEKAIVKAVLLELADVELPAILAAEEAKLPAAYQPLVVAISSALMPSLKAFLDAKIAAI